MENIEAGKFNSGKIAIDFEPAPEFKPVEGSLYDLYDDSTGSAELKIREESDLVFTDQQGLTIVGGDIDTLGRLTFSTGAGEVTVGKFDVGFDANLVTDTNRGLYFESTIYNELVPEGTNVFEVGYPKGEGFNIDSDENILTDTADLFISSEFANILQDNGLTTENLTGLDVGDVSIEAFYDDVTDA